MENVPSPHAVEIDTYDETAQNNLFWNGETLTSKDAWKLVSKFTDIYGSDSLLLAAHTSVLDRIESEVVALIRFNFLSGAARNNRSLDADIIFGPLSYSLGNGYYLMDRKIRRHLSEVLNLWYIENNDTNFNAVARTKQVARFVQAYISRKRDSEQLDSNTLRYLNHIEWGIFAHAQPKEAVEEFARELKRASQANDLTHEHGKLLQFTRIRPLIEDQLSSHYQTFYYAKALEQIARENFEKASRYVNSLPQKNISQGRISLPSPMDTFERLKKSSKSRSNTKTNALKKNWTNLEASVFVPNDTNMAIGDNREADIQSEKIYDDNEIHRALKKDDNEELENCLRKHLGKIDDPDSYGKSALHIAAERGNSFAIKLLCNNGASLEITDSNFETALFHASSNNQVDVINLLVNKYDLPVSTKNKYGATALHRAVECGHLDVIKALISFGIDIEIRDNEGQTPLLLACKHGRYPVFKMLLDKGANLDSLTTNRTGALAMACIGGNPRIVQQLIELGFRVDAININHHLPIMFSASRGNIEAFKLLVRHGADFKGTTEEGRSCIHFASESGDINIIQHIVFLYGSTQEAVDSCFEYKNYKWNPIRLAALNGLKSTVEYFVSIGAEVDTNYNQWNLLHLAAQGTAFRAEGTTNHDYPALITYLIGQGIDVNAQGAYQSETALHTAVRFEKTSEIIAALLAIDSIECNLKNDVEETPFLSACVFKQADNIRLLGQYRDIDFQAANKDKKQALLIAIESECISTVEALLENKSVLRNHKFDDKFESTPIWVAAQKNLLDIFCLLSKDPMITLDSINSSGDSLLHLAAEAGATLVIDQLLQRGFDVNIYNKDEKSPLILAIGKGHLSSITKLIEAGAFIDRYPKSADTSPLETAVLSNNLKSLELLLRLGANIHECGIDGKSLLHLAASTAKSIEILIFLINSGLKVNSLDSMNATPLHDAMENANHLALNYLIENEAYLDQQDINGNTPLHHAIRKRDYRACLALIESGSSITLGNADGWSSLHFAALHNFEEIIDVVCSRAPELINKVTKCPSRTALQIAAEMGNLQIVNALLTYSSLEIELSTEDKLPAIFLAAANGHKEIVNELAKLGASTAIHSNSQSLDIRDILQERIERTQSIKYRPKRPEKSDVRTSITDQKSKSPQPKKTAPSKENESRSTITQPHIFRSKTASSPFNLYSLKHLDFKEPEDPVNSPWNLVKGEERAGFIDQLGAVDGKYKLSVDTTQVLWTALPFYEDVALIRVRDKHWRKPRLCIYYLTDKGNLFRLNGTSPPIHEVNAKAPIRLNEKNALDYLRFFGFFVRGEEGPFYVLESSDDPCLSHPQEATAMSVIEGTVRPALLEGVNEQGQYLAEALISYSSALFIANYAVQPTGMIEMLDDEPIAADLPIKIDAPIS